MAMTTATAARARTAVVVTGRPDRDALDVVLDIPSIDVAIFESPARALARIKRERPAMVIVHMMFDSATEFLLLSALRLDRETASIPIWTCADLRDTGPFDMIELAQEGATCSSSNCFQRS